jgi:hypothetical protein
MFFKMEIWIYTFIDMGGGVELPENLFYKKLIYNIKFIHL